MWCNPLLEEKVEQDELRARARRMVKVVMPPNMRVIPDAGPVDDCLKCAQKAMDGEMYCMDCWGELLDRARERREGNIG